MIQLRPHLRVFRHEGQTHVEALLRERAAPLDEVGLGVLRALAEGPVPSSLDIVARLDAAGTPAPKHAVHGALSMLSGLGLIHTGKTPDDGAAVWDALEAGMGPLPVVDQVELTNLCPMKCVMCPTGTGTMTRSRGWMAKELFDKIVDEIVAGGQQIKPLTLHNLGESLLHPELASMVKRASSVGLETEVSGNPGHLTFARYLALEEAGLTRLVLDIDGLDKATLERIRGPGARGDLAFEHLDRVLEHRVVTGASSPVLVLQMIGMPHNQGQHAEFLARYDRGLPGVEVYVKQLDANTRLGGDLVHLHERPRSQLCRAPWKSVVILWDGTVIPCCHDANGEVALGNVREQSLAAIWKGEPARALRERLRGAKLIPGEPCETCAHRADRFQLPRLDEVPAEPLAW